MGILKLCDTIGLKPYDMGTSSLFKYLIVAIGIVFFLISFIFNVKFGGTMKISEVSRVTGLADSSIRYYEKMGLLKTNRNKNSTYRESFESMNVEEYFLYTEEEEFSGNTYKKIDEWTEGMSQLVQKAYEGNPLICYLALHPRLRYVLMLCLFIIFPVIIIVEEIIEPSIFGLLPYLVIYEPIFITYIVYKKYA